MNDVLNGVLADLTAESDQLDTLVTNLDDDAWRLPTPAPGWEIATQIAHLTWTDEIAVLAATDKEAWDAAVLTALADAEGFVDATALEVATMPRADLLDRWRAARGALQRTLREYPAGQKLPWFGPPMSPTSMATARLMETWAHGLDVADALGLSIAPTDRIRHVAHLGVRTRDFVFTLHGLDVPAAAFRVELTAPSGEVWTWGPDDAPQRVEGDAYDFCLLAVQRRHRKDLVLRATGAGADAWLDIAQAFAGPPGAGREPKGEAP